MSALRLSMVSTLFAITFVGLAVMHEDEAQALADSGPTDVQCAVVDPHSDGQVSGFVSVVAHPDSLLQNDDEALQPHDWEICRKFTVRGAVTRKVCQTRTIYNAEGISVGTVERCRTVVVKPAVKRWLCYPHPHIH